MPVSFSIFCCSAIIGSIQCFEFRLKNDFSFDVPAELHKYPGTIIKKLPARLTLYECVGEDTSTGGKQILLGR